MSERRFPNTYVIISAIIVLCALATWLVPGGQFVKADDGSVSYSGIASQPQSWQIFSALYDGFCRQAGIIVFILVVGGAFWILNATGAVAYGIRRFIAGVGRHEKLVLAGIAVLFSLGGAVFGMSEETIPFVGIVVPLVVSMGYNAVVGFLIVYVAANIGFSGAFLNPFTIGVAQEMADLPLFSGMGYRVLCWCILTSAMVVFTLVYASRIRKAPDAAGMSADAPEEAAGSHRRHALILIVLLVTVVALIVGVTCLHWYISEISALFLAMGVICGVIAGYSANRIADEFVAGAKDIFPAAMVVGLASGIVVILENGHIIDSILHGMATGLDGAGRTGALSLMYGIQTVINLVIPSATAKAAITIPIMAPFSDMIGLSRQAMVLAFQFGDGFTNMITPTSGVLVAALAMARIPYAEWFKIAWKWILALILLGFVLLLPAVFLSITGF